MPSFSRFLRADSVGGKLRSDIWSIIFLLISSGLFQSKLRIPASMWAKLILNFLAAKAPAILEFVSPRTTTKSGFSDKSTFSILSNILAVCSP